MASSTLVLPWALLPVSKTTRRGMSMSRRAKLRKLVSERCVRYIIYGRGAWYAPSGWYAPADGMRSGAMAYAEVHTLSEGACSGWGFQTLVARSVKTTPLR